MIDVCSFQVIGELRENPEKLLVIGDDGQCYAYDILRGEISPLEPDDSWAVDLTYPLEHRVPVTTDHRLAS